MSFPSGITRYASYKLIALICLLALTVITATSQSTPNKANRPNVVIIFTDDQGYQDVGCYGAEGFETPHLDQLARQGIRFTNFYVAQPVCSASRAALLTGCYPNRVGIHGALGPGSDVGLHPDETTIADMLKKQGYATAIFGKWHLGHHPEFLPTQQGFDQYFGLPYSNDMWPRHPEERFDFPPLPLIKNQTIIDTIESDQSQLTTWYTERAVQFIQDHKSEPFFLYVPHNMPHVPLFVSDKFAGTTERGLYGDVIREIDWSVGQIVKTLKDNGLEDNTLVIFTSDNGPWLSYGEHGGRALPLREGKGTAWEGGVRVPCIMRWPGHIPAGTVSKQSAMTIDILPTLAEITGASLPERPIDGLSILPLLENQPGAQNPHEAYYFYYKHNELHAVLSGEWKLYFPHNYRTLSGKVGCDDSTLVAGNPVADTLEIDTPEVGHPVAYEHVDMKEPELYHLSEDIAETRNVAAEHPDVVQRLTALGEQARQELGDALTGQVGEEVREPGRLVAESKQ